MERNLVTISEAARYLGVNIMTLRRWDEEGKLKPIKTIGRHRRYDMNDLEYFSLHRYDDTKVIKANPDKVICYARVSSSDQKEDLYRPSNSKIIIIVGIKNFSLPNIIKQITDTQTPIIA